MKKLLVILSLLAVNAYACPNECELDIPSEECGTSDSLCITFTDYELNGFGIGIRDKTGKITIPAKYHDVQLTKSGAIVLLDGLYGLLDKTGKEIIPPTYTEMKVSDTGMIIAETQHSYLLNNQGKPISKHTKIHQITDDTAQFCESVKGEVLCGVIDKQGKVLVPAIYHIDYPMYDYSVKIKDLPVLVVHNKENKYALLSIKTGKLLTPFKYDKMEDSSEGLIIAILDGKFGFLDINGKEIIKPIYDKVEHFDIGLAKVEKDGERFYIDKTGKRVP